MPRTNLPYDDPINYFRRLESYSSPRPTSFSRPHSYATYSTRSSSPEKFKEDFDEARTNSDIGSRQERDTQARPDSRTTNQSRSEVDYTGVPYGYEKSPQRRQPKSYRHLTPASDPKSWWTRRRKLVLSLAFVLLVIIAIIAGVAAHIKDKGFPYKPSNSQVTNDKAFGIGATRQNPNVTDDGIGKGVDSYRYYTGGPNRFPPSSNWVSFDQMWQTNLENIQSSCSVLKWGPDNTPSQTQDIYNAIQDRAKASLVDHRLILAVVLQESHGCVHVGATSNGVRNPGLMQSHNGDSFSSSHQTLSILAMIQDGTQGTKHGDGLVQTLNIYGNAYSAARGYNSGHIAKGGDLSDAAGATACYVSDIANRLTGWVNADSTCPGDENG